jgi:type III restriction enzyme
LAKLAASDADPQRLIRPIVLVQVERTGKDQRDTGFVHSEQVKEYLIQRLGVPEKAIAIKSAQSDDIEGLDLMDPGCPVEWIITKSALQEGWDCPFAYILVSLNNVGSGLSMTQLVGRVLRQPYQQRTAHRELNECYIYCLHRRAGDIAREVKKALEDEGYEGDAAVVDATVPGAGRSRTVRIRDQFAALYRPQFEGRIYLPRFCIKTGRDYAPLDYFLHLVSRVEVSRFAYDRIEWPLADTLREARDRFFRINLGEDIQRTEETLPDLLETDQQVLAWTVASLPFEYLSHKQLRLIVSRVYDRLCACELSGMVRNRLGLVKFVVRDKVDAFVRDQLDSQTEAAFIKLYDTGRLKFYLECAQCRFEVPPEIEVRTRRRLEHDDGEPITKSLFDYVDYQDVNDYERAVALFIDKHPQVLWWYRNLVGHEHFTVQGFRRNRIRPDFVVHGGTLQKPQNRVIVVESKGKHLEGNPDTEYKRKVADYFEKVGHKVSWQKLGEDFSDHVFRFQVLDEAQERGRDWRDELRKLLSAQA